MADKKLAVHICGGCEIAECLDLNALAEVVEEAPCQISQCLCAEDEVEKLKEEVDTGVDALVIAACSPRCKADLLSFPECVVERVNIREMVTWSHEPNDEDTQMLAEDYVRMGIARARRASLPDPPVIETSEKLLIIGGGLTGMTAAKEASRSGYDVILVEKEPQLGGWRRKFKTLFPSRAPYTEFESPDMATETRAIEDDEHIQVFTSSSVSSISGQPGQFEVEIQTNGETNRTRVGAIVQATGWKPYDATRLDHLGYGRSKNVVTNVEMEEILGNGSLQCSADGKKPRSIAFIQCAGSRDKDHLPYCSTVCCRVTMKQAIEVRRLNPELNAYVLYKDIRTPGQYEDLYRKAQRDPGIFFTKGETSLVEPNGDGSLRVVAEQTLLGERIEMDVDMVVLATGMVPVSADGELIRRYRDAEAVVDRGESGAQLEAAKLTLQELQPYVGESILNLNYRQGPDTPSLRHGFPDSHFICFPYESRRTGIYMAGCLRAPSDSESSRTDAGGAVLKAIQAIELARQGKAVHPRWEDMSFPDFFLQRCTQCKRCTEECPFGVLNEDEKGTPQPNPARCRRCGICLGACPERVISFKDYSIDIVSSMIKSVEIPDEFEEKPRLLGFVCENDAYPALDTAGIMRLRHSAFIRFIPVRCLGSVNIVWIADALSRGFDGILLLGCKSGDDYQCHFIRGSELMKTRSANVREKLKQLALEEERVRIEEVSIADFHRIPKIVNEFQEEIDDIGLNPFKGF